MPQRQIRLMYALPPGGDRAQPFRKESGQGVVQTGISRIVTFAAHHGQAQTDEACGLKAGGTTPSPLKA